MKKPEQGFTLLEVLASLTILGIIMLIFINTMGFTSLSLKNSDRKSEAVRIAEQELNKSLNTISNNPESFSTHASNTIIVSNFPVTIIETEFQDNPTYSLNENPKNYVYVQGITIYSTTQGESKKGLVTVAVKWKE